MRFLLIILATLAACPSASAQSHTPTPQPTATGTSYKPRIDIHVDGDKIEVRLDGRLVPSAQVVRKDQTIELLTKDGRVVRTLHLPPQMHKKADPPVLAGLRFDVLSADLAHHLSLDQAKCSLVSAVMEGGPAAAAGVHALDVVRAISGAESADPASIRRLLASKAAGDSLSVQVLRQGQSLELTIVLAPYKFTAIPAKVAKSDPVAQTPPEPELVPAPDPAPQPAPELVPSPEPEPAIEPAPQPTPASL